MTKAIVLLSGGQDSTTSLFYALRKYTNVRAIGFSYGQRHSVELEAAADIAQLAIVPFDVLPIPALSDLGDSSLTSDAPITSSGGYADAEVDEGLPSSFVPGRNILFFATAAAYAVKHNASVLVSGVCQTDYSGYPDCRREFVDCMERALTVGMPSSIGPIVIDTPLMKLSKAETVQLARDLGDGAWNALARSVTCYNGNRPGCGTCPSCALRQRGFDEAGYADPQR